MTDDRRPVQERDSAFMRRALGLARLGWGQTAPNPMVGAVVVHGDEIVGEGFHARYGEAHAEVLALANAGARARGATLYVTLEPCNHSGRTPPCTEAIIAAGITRVVAATSDPNPVAAGGAARLREADVEVTIGVEEDAARELNAPFFHALRSDRPWVVLKLAVSIDAAITDAGRSSVWLTGPEARRAVHELRANADAIAIGIGTAITDDPELTVRDVAAPRVPPRRVVFDSSARLPLNSRLVRTAGKLPVIVIATRPDPVSARALRDRGVDVITVADATAGMRALASVGVRSLLVEGGAGLARALVSEGLVDRLIIFQAPIILGAGALRAFGEAPGASVPDARRLRIVARETYGDDLMTTYAIEAE